jgi:glycosyltransferase involved in cell wall biosynthesis
VLASDHEGSPNVVLEAMAAGRPVIATACGDVPRLVRDGATGYVVPSGDDVGAMADRMETLAASADLRRKLGGAGRKAVEEGYDRSGLAERLTGIYRLIALRERRSGLAAALPCEVSSS